MVEMIGRPLKENPLSYIAHQIVDLVLETPALFGPFSEAIRDCIDGNAAKLDAILDSPVDIPDRRDEVKKLKGLLVSYLNDPPPDPSWATNFRRGYIVEEMIARLGASALGLTSGQQAKVLRRAIARNEGQRLCGDNDIDVVFTSGKTAEVIECKARLSTWLSGGGHMRSEASRKLKYMLCVQACCQKDGGGCRPWLATFQLDLFREKEALESTGYAIGLINGEAIREAIVAFAKETGVIPGLS